MATLRMILNGSITVLLLAFIGINLVRLVMLGLDKFGIDPSALF